MRLRKRKHSKANDPLLVVAYKGVIIAEIHLSTLQAMDGLMMDIVTVPEVFGVMLVNDNA